jgi:hypothetical protein
MSYINCYLILITIKLSYVIIIISKMFEPQYICITSIPDDPIRQLIKLRLTNINNKNSNLDEDFL